MSTEREARADAVRLFLREEGIVLDFGVNVTPEDSDEDVLETVAKVVVAPTTFRRLSMALQEAVSRLPPGPGDAPPPPAPARAAAAPAAPPPARTVAAPPAAASPRISFIGAESGAAPAPTKPPLEDLLEPTIDLSSSRAVVPAASEHAARLQERVNALGAPYVQERSFRMRPGELLANRFLLSVGRPDDGSASDEALTAVFRDIGLPAAFVDAAQQHLPGARCVHFGFEGDGAAPLFKVYLEVGGPEHVDEASGEPVLEHIAYKWDPADADKQVVGRYLWYPNLTAEQIRARVAAVYDGAAAASQEIAFEVIGLAAGRMPERDIHYLEIEEEGNARRSYSINFYDADLQLRSLHPALARMRQQYDIPPSRFQVLYDQIKKRRFGHLAGGVHRNGKDFFNVYYGPQFFDMGTAEGPWRAALMRGGPPGTAAQD